MNLQCLTKNDKYRIDYCIANNVNIYDPNIADMFQIIFCAYHRKCLIKSKGNQMQPNPHFKEFEKQFAAFNLCYLMYSNITEPDPIDSDFDIGFNNSDICFEETIYNITKRMGYHVYSIYDNKKISQDVLYSDTDSFSGFIISEKELSAKDFDNIELYCNDLVGIDKVLSLNAAMLIKTPYYANYNYVLFFNDSFDAYAYIKEVFGS